MIFNNRILNRFFKKGLSVSEWIREKGFDPLTKVIQGKGTYYGVWGKPRKEIYEALHRDGFINKKELQKYLKKLAEKKKIPVRIIGKEKTR